MQKHRTSLEFPLELWHRLCATVPARKRSHYILQAIKEKMGRESIKVLVLCGGEGMRMRPLTLNIPKPMLPLGYKPLLERTVEWFKGQGFHDFIFAIGYLGEHIVKYFGDGSRFGVRIEYSSEERALGTGGAIKHAENFLTNTFIVVFGDVIFGGLNVNNVLRFHKHHGGLATLAVASVDDVSRFGVVKSDSNGKVVFFQEKPKQSTKGWANAGLYVLDPQVLSLILPYKPLSFEREILPVLTKKGELYAYEHRGYWADIGVPRDYERVCKDFFEGKLVL